MSWKPIVVGVDGTPASARAAALGSMIAQRASTTCQLVYAVPDYQKALSLYGMSTGLAEAAKDMLRRDREVVTASLRGLVPGRMLDALQIRAGRAPIVLREVAKELDAELLIVGSRERHGLGRLRGSLVTHLLRTCDVPVLAATGGSTLIHRVLAALDLSQASEATLDAARRWARLFGAHLRIMHVVEPMPVIPEATIQISEEYYRADEQLRETGIWSTIDDREAEKVVRSGYAATTIANEAAQWRADLVIVGSHGRNWAERFLIGSTAEELLDHPSAPTLVVPTGKRADDRPIVVEKLPWEEQRADKPVSVTAS